MASTSDGKERPNDTQKVAADELRTIVERIERLEEEKAAIGSDIKDVLSEAKGKGYDDKVIREIIRLRKQNTEDRQNRMAVLDLYLDALGMGGVFG
jgi:uncharacterized protein (UPF0335 family)